MEALKVSVIFIALLMVATIVPNLGDVDSMNSIEEKNYITYNSNLPIDFYFNEGAGTNTYDDSERSSPNIGSLINNPGWTNGKDFNNNALHFNPLLSQSVVVQSSGGMDLENEDYWAISANIKTDPVSNDPNEKLPIITKVEYTQIVGGWGFDELKGYSFYINNVGHLCFDAYNYDYPGSIDVMHIEAAGIVLKDSDWHFVGVSYYNGLYALYIDPTIDSKGLVTTQSSNIKPGSNNANVKIGCGFAESDIQLNTMPQTTIWYYRGIIDDVHINLIDDTLPWGLKNQGYWTFDEDSVASDQVKYINDRCSWNNEDRGSLTGATFTSNSIKGPNALQCINTIQSSIQYAQIPDDDDSLDLNKDGIYIDLWFKLNNEEMAYHTLAYKKDENPDNGYHLLVWISADPPEYTQLRGSIVFRCYNNDEYFGFSPASQNIQMNTWYRVVIKQDGDFIRMVVVDNSDNIIVNGIEYSKMLPGESNSDLFLGAINPSHTVEEDGTGLNGIIDDFKIGGYRPRNINLPFDFDDEPVDAEGVYTATFSSPEVTSNSPYGKALSFDGKDDGLRIIHYPYMEYNTETYHFEAQIFPFDKKIYDEEEASDPDDELVIARYNNWVLYIDTDNKLKMDIDAQSPTTFQFETISTENEIEYFKWHRVNISVNYKYYELYLNNILVGRETVSTPDPQGSVMDVGYGYLMNENGYESTSKSFYGYIDEVRYCANTPEPDNWNLLPLDFTPQLSLDFDEGGGFIANDNSGFNNIAKLGRGMTGKATNDGDPNPTYQIFKSDGTGFPSWVDSYCTVTINGGSNKGTTKDIISVDPDTSDGIINYISVGSSNPYNTDIDTTTVYYIQKNDPTWDNNGIYGKCLDFDNTEDLNYAVIEKSDSLCIENQFSVEFWMKTESQNGFVTGSWNNYPTGASDQQGSFFIELVNGKIKFTLCKEEIEVDPYYQKTYYGREMSIESQNTISTNVWRHIRCSLSDGIARIFINGNLDATSDLQISSLYSPDYNDNNIFIGNKESVTSLSGFNGKLDNYEIFINDNGYGITSKHFDFESIGPFIDDKSIFNNDGTNQGVTSTTGKYGMGGLFDGSDHITTYCSGFNTYTLSTWVKVNQGSHCISTYAGQHNTNNVDYYPAIFRIDSTGKLSLETSQDNRIYSRNTIEWGAWNHISYSISSSLDNRETSEENSVSFFINGMFDSTLKNVEFQAQNPTIGLVIPTSYIGMNPGDIWDHSGSPEYFTGTMDEFQIKNGPSNQREDLDCDDMPNCYELIRSPLSDQYCYNEHNYRVAILFAPHFGDGEQQYVYDITNMRFNLNALDYKDDDILFMADTENDQYDPYWLDADWIDGEPRHDCLGYVLDALEFGGPAYIYSFEGDTRYDNYYSIPKLTNTDMLFLEMRDHGVGYFDSPAPNSDTDQPHYDVYYGWRGGRCSSVESDGTNAEEEGVGSGEYDEEEFAFEPHYFKITNQAAEDNDPDFFNDERYYQQGGYQGLSAQRYTIDLDGDEYLEELYLILEYDPTVQGFYYGPDYTKPNSPTLMFDLWIRIYMDGYDFDDDLNSDSDGDGFDNIWDGQVRAWNCNSNGGFTGGFIDPLRLVGLDFNEDDIKNYYSCTDFIQGPDEGTTTGYGSVLSDYIDVDEGIVCLYPVGDVKPTALENSQDEWDEGPGTVEGAQFPFVHIWFDDDLASEIDDLSFNDLSVNIDACFSGGFLNEFSSISSTFLASNREEDLSYRYNVMFYSRIRGEITSTYYQYTSTTTPRILYLDENRDNAYYDPDRYSSVNADGARGLDSVSGDPGTDHNGDRDILWDNLNDYSGILGLYNDIISVNEAMLFIDAILADHYDIHGINDRVTLNKAYWEHDPVLSFKNKHEKQIYL